MAEMRFCSLCGFTHGPDPTGAGPGCRPSGLRRPPATRPTAPAPSEAATDATETAEATEATAVEPNTVDTRDTEMNAVAEVVTSDEVTAAPPRPSAPAMPGSVPRPARPMPELFSAASRIQHEDVPTGARIAGGILLLNVLLMMLERALTPSAPGAPVPGSGMLVSAVIDLFIGYKLLRGTQGSTVLGWARFRVVAGLLVFTVIQLAGGNFLLAFFQLLFSAGLLMLLWGDPGKIRMALGVLVTGSYFALATLGLIFLVIGKSSLTQLALLGQADGAALTSIDGVKFRYSLAFPAGSKWYLRDAAISHKESPDSDRWIVRPDQDAHVLVIAEALTEPLDMQPLREAVLANLQKASDQFAVIDEQPLALPGLDGSAVLLTTRRKVGGVEIQGYVALILREHDFYQVLAFTVVDHFAAMAPELKGIVESFKLPPSVPAS